MAWSWGYSPKIEKFIPLGDFPADRYLIVVKQVIENLGWKLSHVSESGIIAYTGISIQSYGEEISIRIKSNFVVFKSECIGIQLLFTDYGKNSKNLNLFFNEFEYAEYHLKEIWGTEIKNFRHLVNETDDTYFERSPLVVKDRIKNLGYLFLPQKGYIVTPVIIIINVLFWVFCSFFLSIVAGLYSRGKLNLGEGGLDFERLYLVLGANSRALVLKGEWWRLITQQFMHFSFSHIFFNMYALIYIGIMVENKLGSWKTFVTYILSGICGGMLSVVMHKTGIMGGASGPILGLFGAFLALLVSNAFEKKANNALLISTIILVTYMLVNGAIRRQTDNAAHIGGLLSGFLICYLLYHERFVKINVPIAARYAVCVLLVAITGTIFLRSTPNYQTKEFEKLQETYLKNAAEFNQVYSIERSFAKEKKLAIIKTSGLEKWKENQAVVKKMNKLLLDEKQILQREYDSKTADKGYELATLMYKQSEIGSPVHQAKIQKLMKEMYGLSGELSKKINEMEKN